MQTDLAFPQSLAEKYRPLRIAEFHRPGETQENLLGKFAAKSLRPAAWLFVGPSGVGKSTMALALASQIRRGDASHCQAGSATRNPSKTPFACCYYMPMTPGGLHLVLADEADRMTNAAQLALLSKLDATASPPNTILFSPQRHCGSRTVDSFPGAARSSFPATAGVRDH